MKRNPLECAGCEKPCGPEAPPNLRTYAACINGACGLYFHNNHTCIGKYKCTLEDPALKDEDTVSKPDEICGKPKLINTGSYDDFYVSIGQEKLINSMDEY